MNELEKTIVDALLLGPGDELAVLRQQAAASTVGEREHTGVGFYTSFSVPAELPRIRCRSRTQLGDVSAEVEGVEHGMGFILWIEHGAIDCLEGFTYTGTCPATPRLLRWNYLTPADGKPASLVKSEARDVDNALRRLAG
jgi:hypothetical protein